MVENWPAECAGGPGAINTKLSKQYSISKGGATAGQPATDFTDGTDSNRTASLTPSRQGAKGTAETTKCAKSAKGIGFGVRRQAKRDAALDRERDSRTAELRTRHAGRRGFTDGTDSEWDRDSQSGAAAVGLVTAVQREQSGREGEENYESREKREIGNFWRGKLRLARFADRDRTAGTASYGLHSAAEPQPN